MARTRGVVINESVDELEQLRKYYKGKPAARRLLFLYMLKSDPKSTIAVAAEKVGITERRGRYWWDSYRKLGLQGLLDRRGWGQGAMNDLEESEEFTGGLGRSASKSVSNSSDPAMALMNELSIVAQNSEEGKVVEEVKKSLISYLPDVDYIVVNIRYGVDVNSLEDETVNVFRQHISEEGEVASFSGSSNDYLYTYKQLIEEGKQRGFPFEKYHYPPQGFDFYLDEGRRERSKDDSGDTYIASLLFFRAKHEEPMSTSTIGFVERIRPFLTFLFTFIIAKQQLRQSSGGSMSNIVKRIGKDADLTLREQRVLSLIFNGSSYAEIADLLHVSLNTVQTHVKNIYGKAKVNKMGELFAKYLTPVYFGVKDEEL